MAGDDACTVAEIYIHNSHYKINEHILISLDKRIYLYSRPH